MIELRRHLSSNLEDALDASRVVVLHGPRQSGKSTLARRIATRRGGDYVTLDDDDVLAVALDDPHSFVRAFRAPMVIDEVQRAGDRLVRAVKLAVDDGTNATGRFLLTGSSNFLTVPTISESLAGRAVILTLWPFSQAELGGAAVNPVERWFDDDLVSQQAANSATGRADYLAMACAGGYPEAQPLGARGRQRWFSAYAETVVSRDIAQLGDIRRAALLPRVLRLAAAQTAGELNVSRWADQLGADRATVQSYLGWLTTVFLVHELPSWRRSRTARVVQRPKLHISDSGLAAGLLGLTEEAVASLNHPMTGPLLETFAVNEIVRLCAAAEMPVSPYHYRDSAQGEVDLVIERSDGAVVAVEIKATSSPRADDLRHLARFRDRLDAVEPGSLRAGVLLHTGTNTLPQGDRLLSASLDTLWNPPPN
ncbi:MAG: ATP-binding protein [Acidimicrobiales bacterium]|nr:ATP-binding protein [Acidimicrobiaceae bacterium]MXV88575.1 ATP-binding protein [Acidimicrobiales bacterium]MXX42593.1 ATP-binding protein [Acidimicrobiales bacterium]MYA24926.1 ATP-binding protein [Acidimicrobiales bacterium]MYB82731.1 ATP-binding protein [Acidimicrobiales bacterium]